MTGVLQRTHTSVIPHWFAGTPAGRFFEAQAMLCDELGQFAVEGMKARIPYAGSGAGTVYTAEGERLECGLDSLAVHARDRGISIYQSEPERSRRYRVSRWRQLWALKGTIEGRLRSIQPYFLGPSGAGPLPTIRAVHQSGEATPRVTWHRLSGGDPADPATSVYYRGDPRSPSNFNFDAAGTNSAQLIAPAWTAPTAYAIGDERTNDGGKLYRVVGLSGGGTSSPGAGPTGTGAAIIDGGVTWDYVVPWSRLWIFIEAQDVNFQSLINYDAGYLYDDGWIYDGVAVQVASDLVGMAGWGSAHGQLWGVAVSSQALDPYATPTQDGDGRWNWPGAGEWGYIIDPSTNQPTRPKYLSWLLDRSQA